MPAFLLSLGAVCGFIGTNSYTPAGRHHTSAFPQYTIAPLYGSPIINKDTPANNKDTLFFCDDTHFFLKETPGANADTSAKIMIIMPFMQTPLPFVTTLIPKK